MQRTLIIFLLFSLFLAGCFSSKPDTSSKNKTRDFLTVVDATGKPVVIPKNPGNIVVLGPPLYTEILIDLKALERIVAVVDSPNNPPETAQILKTGTPLQPDIEMVVNLKPDIVLGAFGEVRAKLEQAGIPVILAGKNPDGFIRKLDDVYETISMICLVLYGDKTMAETLIAERKAQIQKTCDLVASKPRTGVAVVYSAVEGTIYVEGKGTLTEEILQYAGCYNIFSDIILQQISIERLIQKDPEVIITDPSQVRSIIDNRLLSPLKAIKNKKLFGIPASQWTSSRFHLTVQTLVRCLHSDD